MRAKAIAAIAAATAIAALAVPGAAAAHGAATRRGLHDRVTVASFSLLGSRGFAISVNLTNRRRLKITAVPEREQLLEHIFEFAATEYRLDAPQPRGSNGIKASLGRFGSIDLRFRPESATEQVPALFGCKGDKAMITTGSFVGHVDFRGEHGYTRARSTKVPGTVTNLPSPAAKCHGDLGKTPNERSPEQRSRAAILAMANQATKPESHLLELGTNKTVGNRRIHFAAIRLSAPHKGKEATLDTFLGTIHRDLGRIQEQGTAFALLAIGPYFKVPDLTHMTSEAVIAPPKPFLGSATFQRESAEAVSWAGDLRMKPPGFGVVPLAGNGFETVVCEDSGCRTHK